MTFLVFGPASPSCPGATKPSPEQTKPTFVWITPHVSYQCQV